jgi:hypothetical protein
MSSGPWRTMLAAAGVVFLPLTARAQNDVPVGRVRFLSGFEARGLTFKAGAGLKSVTEVAIPFGVIYTVSPRFAVDLGIRYASATQKPETDTLPTSTVSGPTDLQVRGVYQLVPDVVVLTVSANVPTGKTKLADDELLAAGAVASELVPFPVSSFGSGANVTSGVAVAVPMGGWAVGLSGAYRLSGSFTPRSSLVDTALNKSYKPGGELRLRVGADRLVGQGRISLGFTFSSFAQDEFGGSSIFQPGQRYVTQGAWSFPVGNVGLAVYVWDLYRTAGKNTLVGQSTEKQNVLTAGAAASVQLGPNVLRPQVEYRIRSAGASSLASAGHLLSLSARYQWTLSPRIDLLPALRFDTGSIAEAGTLGASGAAVDFTGWGLSLGLRATL